MPVILGVDPSTTGLGYCFYDSDMDRIEQSGCFKFPRERLPVERLEDVMGHAEMLLPRGSKVNLVAVERMFSTRSAADARLAVAAFFFEHRAWRLGIRYVELSVGTVRKEVVGAGNVDKETVRDWIEMYYGVRPDSLDETDAIAVALAAIRELKAGAPGKARGRSTRAPAARRPARKRRSR